MAHPVYVMGKITSACTVKMQNYVS